MVGTATDITGRRETPLHLFVEQAPAALALLDRHMRYVAVSERWQADLGLSGQDLRGRGHYEIFPSTGEAIRNAHRRCLAGAIDDATDESSIACADGRTRWIRLTARPWRDASGDIDGLLMGAEDVTDRVRARQLEADCADWRLTAERFRLALRGSPVSVFEQDLDLRFMWVHNPDPAIGMGANGLIGMRDSDLLERAEDGAAIEAIKRDVIHTGVSRREEVRVRVRGVERHYDLLVDPLRGADGRIRGVTCATVDITERKRADADLAAKTALLEAVLRHAPIGILVIDPSGAFVSRNRSFEDIFGQDVPPTIKDYAGWSVTQADGTPRDPGEDAAVVHALRGETVAHKFRFIRSDGAERWVRITAAPIRDALDRIVAAVGLVQDISKEVELAAARDRLLAQIEADRARLNELLMSVPVPIAVYAPPDFRIEMVNEAYQAIVPGVDLIGKPVREALAEIPIESTLRILSEVCRTKEASIRREHAVPLVGPDGRVEERLFTSTFQPMCDDAGNVLRVVVANIEVTQEVRARQLIVDSAERLGMILDEMPVGVVVRDGATAEVLLANKASREILGADVRDGQSPATWELWTFRHPDGRLLDPDEHAFRRAMRTGSPVRNQVVHVVRADTGNEVVIRSNAAPVRVRDGRLLIVSVFEDISEEHHLQAARMQTLRFAELFVGILGHDLRNPLNAITVGLSLLRQRALDRDIEGARATIDRINRSANRMARMVAQILDLTRARLAGGLRVEAATTDLVKIVSAAVDELAMSHPARALNCSLPREMVGLWDGDRLAQVISNLVGNALEHGDPARPVIVRLEGRDDVATLTVHNDGPPIPEDRIDVLFDPFWRAARDARTSASGLGLGLYISREIVVAHGGDVRVHSTWADGTTFVVTLPGLSHARTGGP